MTDPDKTVPGTLPTEEVFTITPAMSKASRERAEKEAFENAKEVVESINEEAASGREPGSSAGDEEAERAPKTD